MAENIERLDPFHRYPEYERKTLDAIKGALTIDTDTVKSTVKNIYIDRRNEDKFTSPAHLKDIKLKNGTFYSDIKADIETEVDGKKATIKGVSVGKFPELTPHWSFIIGGSEYSMPSQARLRPGVYTRIKENGIVESHFNFEKSSKTRIPFRLEIEPETSLFKIRVAQGTVDLYPLLIGLGIPETKIKESWGAEILDINKGVRMNSEDAVIKFAEIVSGKKGLTITEGKAIAADYFGGANLDKRTTEITLGKAFDKVTPEAILSATRRIVRVNKMEERPDDRDSIVFKSLHTFDDFVSESINKAKDQIRFKYTRNLKKFGPTKGVVPRENVVAATLKPFTGGLGLAEYHEQLNPYHIQGKANELIITGEGGIGSLNAITLDARAVHPSTVGVIDPIPTSQSEKVGATQKLAVGAYRKGDSLATEVYNLKAKKKEVLSPLELYKHYVAFSDQFKDGKLIGEKIRAVHNGEVEVVPRAKIEYAYVGKNDLFSLHTLSVPFMSSNQGNRMLMAANMLEQAVPLSDPDVPLVKAQKGIPSRIMATVFDKPVVGDGVVAKITDDAVHIKGKGGVHRIPLYKNYPLNKSYVDSRPTVKVGDKVKAGDIVTEGTFTRNGEVALGKNLQVAYMPFKGYNHEDAIVISESAAKKTASNHVFKYEILASQDGMVDKKKFAATFPSLITRDNLDKLDDLGMAKKGATINPGDVVITYMVKRKVTPELMSLGRIHKQFMRPWKSMAVTYDGEVPGKVVDTSVAGGKYKVYIHTVENTIVGDKLVNFHAAKGIIGNILPDSEMPHTKDGKPVDVLINPNGIIGRVNPGQILELAAGKIAQKTGKPYFTNDFNEEKSNLQRVKEDLKKHGLSDKEELFDPSTGKSYGKITTGPQHIFKLKQRAAEKIVSRSRGSYDVDKRPTHGGDEGGKAIDSMLYSALLAHNAKHNLQEMATYKGEQNEEFWNAIQTGNPLPAPKVPFTFNKMVGMLHGAGVNVEKKGDSLYINPLTDKHILAMSNGEVGNAAALRAKNLSEVKGGLFDPKVTGGMAGDKFSHIKLTEPILNPLFAKTTARLLGMTATSIDDIATGSKFVDVGGKSLTGGAAIKALLKGVDINKKIKEEKENLKVLKGTKLSDANKNIRVLENLKKLSVSPDEAFILHNIPVIPPVYRPIYPMNTGQLRVSPVNYMYQDILMMNEASKAAKNLPDAEKKNIRSDLYKTVKATFGLDAPLSSTVFRAGTDNLPGLMEVIRGDTAKEGYFQDKVWRKTQDLSARSVVAPGPELGMDEVGLPMDMGWNVYKPFIIQKMVRMGRKVLDAQKEWEQRTPIAKAALEQVVKERPIFINRAPTTHKYGVVALNPKLIDEKVMRLPTFILKGMGADYDGDALQAFVPVTTKAVEEARSMMPSQISVNPSTLKPEMVPRQEEVYGLYEMSRVLGKSNASFKTVEEAENAVRTGKIKVNHTVRIAGKNITTGQALLQKLIPSGLYKPGEILDAKKIESIASELSKNHKDLYAPVMNKMKDYGYEHSHAMTIGIDDLEYNTPERKKLLAKHKKIIEASSKSALPGKLYKAITEIEGKALEHSKKSGSSLYHIVTSGAGGKISDVKQILTTPVTVGNHRDEPLPTVFQRSYGEGLGLSDFWMASYGARRGVIGRSLMTSEPGTLMKRTIATMTNQVITTPDCKTNHGITLDIDSRDVMDRLLASPLGAYRKDDVVTSKVVSDLKKKGFKKLVVRSPITCEAVDGICQKCFGVGLNGQFPRIGDNVGTEHGQYIAEPLFQSQMGAFHSGNVVKTNDKRVDGYHAVKQLLEMTSSPRGKAAIATKAGKVDKIENAPAGGKFIHIGGVKHYSLPGSDIFVKKGQSVQAGERLSSGFLKPVEYLEATHDPVKTQNEIVNELQNTYKQHGYKQLSRRSFELFARSVGNFGEVVNPGDSEFLAGDTVKLSKINSVNKDLKNKVVVQPKLFGVETAPLKENDWIVRLGFKRLKDVFEPLASVGAKSNIKNNPHPLPKYVYGPNFAEGGYEEPEK